MASADRAVLFDIGNVLVRWDPRRLYRTMFDDPDECDRFLNEVCTMAWHGAHDAGVSMAENAATLTARFPRYRDQIAAWNTRWDDMFDGSDPGVVSLVSRLLDADVPLFALTNLPAEKKAHIFSKLPFLDHFADVIVSGEEGCVKPDPRIYDIAIARMGRPPHSVIFIDDRDENVAAARAHGLNAVQFTDAAALARDLAEFGVLTEGAPT